VVVVGLRQAADAAMVASGEIAVGAGPVLVDRGVSMAVGGCHPAASAEAPRSSR